MLRTAHAARALRRHETAARRRELACGLAYWAARHTELPTRPDEPGAASLQETLRHLEHPWLDDRTPVDFAGVTERLTAAALAPPADLAAAGPDPRAALDALVHAAAEGFLEMLVVERHRIWVLHTVTGPAAVGLLLPEVDPAGARALVEYARQAVVALYAAFGEPFAARAHLRTEPPPWPELIQRAADSRSVHTVKLIEALVRFEHPDDPLFRSVAAQFYEWT